jgi:hypothetical protein
MLPILQKGLEIYMMSNWYIMEFYFKTDPVIINDVAFSNKVGQFFKFDSRQNQVLKS